MTDQKKKIHIVASTLLNPTNPVSVNLIGAGGTGSQLLTALARMNYALTQMNHAGLFVTVFDPDTVETANLGRQLFSVNEVGMNKAVSMTNRVNRFFGTNWKGVAGRFETENTVQAAPATINLSCVDSVVTRLAICESLSALSKKTAHRDSPLYWMDFGNGRDTGQVMLATLAEIHQPPSDTYQTVPVLKSFIPEFRLLKDRPDDLPSCSLAQALGRQDLFINSSLASIGASLLWSMFREGILENRGFFLNLKTLRTQPLRL
jgi:PRTRC genetic system ThiF family protein